MNKLLKHNKILFPKKERASHLEESFGHEKEHDSLKRIKAGTEKLWIFFGIHTANTLQIGHRLSTALALKQAV